jgi:hypothetical protein
MLGLAGQPRAIEGSVLVAVPPSNAFEHDVLAPTEALEADAYNHVCALFNPGSQNTVVDLRSIPNHARPERYDRAWRRPEVPRDAR